MAIETEVKLLIRDLDLFRTNLERRNPVRISERHFEDNYVLDFPDAQMRWRGRLLRIRITSSASFLTFKDAALPESSFKIREELETAVKDGLTALEILRRTGLQVWFRYQKYREEFSVVLGKRGGEVHVALDETPVGTFAELEGKEELIRRVAEKVGFSESHFIKDSYYSLYLRYCGDRGVIPGNMLFAAEGNAIP
jgi:adenylate cyclase class 2